MYTIEIPGGGSNLALEHGLAQLESRFAHIRDKKLKNQEPLDPGEHIVLCAFISAMYARTASQREHLSGQYNKVVEVADQMMKRAKTATNEQKIRAAAATIPSSRERSFSYDEVKLLAEKPLQETVAPRIIALVSLLAPLDCAILSYDGDSGFITSDSPCVWCDSEAYKRHPFYQAPALMYESIEITLPISPQQVALVNRRSLKGYIAIDRDFWDGINRRTRFNCAKYFVNNRNETRVEWFDPGTEPDDSWRKMNPESDKEPVKS